MTNRSGKYPPELRCYWMKASSQPSDSRNGKRGPLAGTVSGPTRWSFPAGQLDMRHARDDVSGR
jgi:hypothetical protein